MNCDAARTAQLLALRNYRYLAVQLLAPAVSRETWAEEMIQPRNGLGSQLRALVVDAAGLHLAGP